VRRLVLLAGRLRVGRWSRLVLLRLGFHRLREQCGHHEQPDHDHCAHGQQVRT
jgi:hypothetical protein